MLVHALGIAKCVSLKRIKASLEVIECVPLETTPILMVDCYQNP